MNELNDYFRRSQGYSLLDPNLDQAPTLAPAQLSPAQLAPGVPAMAVPELPSRDQFDFAPSPQQEKQALFSSLARMGAAMLANNRGPNAFASALGHGLGAQQEGYQGALQASEAANTKALQSQMLRSKFGEQQFQRTLQEGLRTALGKLDQNDPEYWGQVGRLYAAAGEMDTAMKAQELAGGGKPTEAVKNLRFLTAGGMPQTQALDRAFPIPASMQPQLQWVQPTPTSPGGFVDTRRGTTNLNVPPTPPKPVPLKEIPGTALKSIAENRSVLTKYDNLLTKLENEVKTGGTALGAWNYLGDPIRQRTDKAGVELRAAIAEAGGQVIHDRAGAAQSAQETGRLKPYIPNLTDEPQVALDKLRILRENVANETNALAEMYPSDQGYKPLAPWQSPRAGKPKQPPSQPAPPARQAPTPRAAAFGTPVNADRAQRLYEKSKAQGDTRTYEQFVSALRKNGVRVQ